MCAGVGLVVVQVICRLELLAACESLSFYLSGRVEDRKHLLIAVGLSNAFLCGL